jgi:hypothetical protein
MKQVLQWGIVFALFVFQGAETYAQVISPLQVDEPGPGVHQIAHHPYLVEQELKVRTYLAEHPEVVQAMRMRKTDAWSFSVGSTKTWYADNLVTGARYQVPSTCRAVGAKCYVFAENTSWTDGRVTQAVIDSVVANFDLRTPANSSKGIYQMDTEAFGNPPDIDSDPRIIILILDIQDGSTSASQYTGGYFFSFNEIPAATPGYSTSNQAEIFFLDCNPAPLTTAKGMTDGMSTLAHEFQHMIHFNYDTQEITFLNEGCALVAEVHCGYGVYYQTPYVNETNHYLFDWRRGQSTVITDYSRAARYTLYLHNQFGVGLFKSLVANPLHGIDGVNATLASIGTSRRFADILPDWFVANILDDASVDAKYGYSYSGLPKAIGTIYGDPNASGSGVIQNLAAQYLSFVGGANLSITFTVSYVAVTVKAVEIGPAGKRVLDVTPGVTFTEPAFGKGYTTIHFVIMNNTEGGPYSYSFVSSGSGGGAMELKWDTAEPSGFLTQTAGDTVCVTFDGIAGARLDSIRVALRRASTMTGGVWSYTGSSAVSPLGTMLAVPISASISTTSPLPYPVPWANWATVDLHTRNIDASQAFAVAFVNTGVGSATGDPRVMVAPYPSSSAYHSYSYLNSPSSGTPGWYYQLKALDTVWVYLIRAYVSILTTGASSSMELLPSRVALGQNYPNPFNPTSDIQYQISESGPVRLTVYDLLGREVAVLVNRMQSPGTYQVRFDAAGIAGGVYLYRLTAGDSSETKRMVYVK